MSPEPKREPSPGRTGNRLLDRLPEEEYDRLAPCLVSESLGLKQILVEGDDPIRDVYFPTTAVISTLVVLEDGSEVETTLTGVEGMVGLPVALDEDLLQRQGLGDQAGGQAVVLLFGEPVQQPIAGPSGRRFTLRLGRHGRGLGELNICCVMYRT